MEIVYRAEDLEPYVACPHSTDNLARLADAMALSIEQVQQGTSLAKSLAACPLLFPSSITEVIAVAEESGRLDQELIRLANTHELETMYAMLQETLVKIDFISHQNPEHWMLNVRRLFNRHGLLARETQVIKGICRQIDWYVRTRLATGKKESREGGGEPAS